MAEWETLRPEELEPHPIALLFPDGTPDENRELARNIKASGLHQDIWLYEDALPASLGKKLYILDGRRRHDACIIEQVEPRYQIYTGDDPLGFAMSLNFHRRHLTISDRKRIAAEMLKANPSQTSRDVAKKTGINRGTVEKVREQVQAEASPNVQNGHKDSSSGPESSSEQAPPQDAYLSGITARSHTAEQPSSGIAPPLQPKPRVEAGLKKDGTPRQQRGRKPSAAPKIAKTPKEAKPKPIVRDRDAWVVETSAQFKKDPKAAIEAIGMIVRDLPTKRELTLKFLSVVGYTPVTVGDDISF